MCPSFFSSSKACAFWVMSLSSNWTFLCERLFRLAAEHSTGLGINHDSLHIDLTLAVRFRPIGALLRRDRAPSSKLPAFHLQRCWEQNGCRVSWPALRSLGLSCLSCSAQKHHMRDMRCSGQAQPSRRMPDIRGPTNVCGTS